MSDPSTDRSDWSGDLSPTAEDLARDAMADLAVCDAATKSPWEYCDEEQPQLDNDGDYYHGLPAGVWNENCGWIVKEIDIPNHAAGGKNKRRMVECLWRNY